ncbi:MAG: transposase [Ktedonobacteraceae bacterium]
MACSSSMARTFPSMGITRQVWRERRCGNPVKKDNCQASIFLGYASRQGATLLDRRLYLPESWFEEDHQTRWQDCRIPDRPLAETKHELAAQLVEKVMADGRLTKYDTMTHLRRHMQSLADRSPAQKERKKRKQGNSRRNHRSIRSPSSFCAVAGAQYQSLSF